MVRFSPLLFIVPALVACEGPTETAAHPCGELDNRWPAATLVGYEGDGVQPGADALDFEAEDDAGDAVCLSQFLDDVTVLEFTTGWVVGMQGREGDVAELQAAADDAGAWWVTMLVQNAQASRPTQEEAMEVAALQPGAPLLLDTPGEAVRALYDVEGFPTVLTVAPGGEIIERWSHMPTTAELLGALP